ncbi:MAG TPA: acyltransferase family protein, partial [Gammaproteobacteria bacterium]|nr:acyltransferase family protein [Gammaproteobacteria bacterium]
WSHYAPQLAFYMMPARAWQFALGALVFMFFGMHPQDSGTVLGFTPNRLAVRAAGWMGLLLVLGSAVFLNGKIVYPGAWALLPSFGAALIILAGTYRQPGTVTGLLSTRPMQAIGRVSYSWYLWHWPVLLLGTSVFLVHSLWGRVGLALLSFLIASASYLFVEKPIRRRKLLVIKPHITVFASLGIMALAALLALAWHRNVATELASPAVARYARAHWDSPAVYSMGCDSWYHSARVTECYETPRHPRHTVVIMGDSITMQWFPAVKKIFQKKNWKITAITKSSCPMVDVPVFYAHIHGIYTVCSKWRANALKKVVKIRPDTFIFSSYYAYPYDKQQWIDGTRKILREISPAVRHIYIIRPTPILPFSGPDCLEPHSAFYKWLDVRDNCTAKIQSTRFKHVYHWLEVAASGFPNVKTIDMTRFICPHKLCHAELDGKIVFRDDEHLTASFAKTLTPDLDRKLFGRPMKKMQTSSPQKPGQGSEPRLVTRHGAQVRESGSGGPSGGSGPG